MEGWWTLVLFGAVVPAGMIGALVLRDRFRELPVPARAGWPPRA
jgi:hypothetical protein